MTKPHTKLVMLLGSITLFFYACNAAVYEEEVVALFGVCPITVLESEVHSSGVGLKGDGYYLEKYLLKIDDKSCLHLDSVAIRLPWVSCSNWQLGTIDSLDGYVSGIVFNYSASGALQREIKNLAELFKKPAHYFICKDESDQKFRLFLFFLESNTLYAIDVNV